MAGLLIGTACLLATAEIVSAEIIDDFDGGSLVASWWGADSSAPYVYTIDFANTQHVHSGAFSLMVDFDKRNDNISPYSFLSASGLFNLRNFDYLSFWVYNTGTPLRIKVRLEDADGHPWETDWADIWPMMKTAVADWENLVVDLTRGFSATGVNWTAIENIMFMVSPGDVTNRGTFWVDDVALTRAPNEAPLEPFESDFYGWSGGGAFANLGLWTQDFHNAGTPASLGQQSLKITWPAKGANYDNFIYTPCHDTNSAPLGRIGNYPNFRLRTNTTLTVWVKSPTDNNMPLLIKLDDDDIATVNYTGAGAWQQLSCNYRYNPSAPDVQTVYFMPYPGASDNGGEMYVDDMCLTGGEVPPIPLAPTGLTATAFSEGVYTVSWKRVTIAYRYQLQESRDQNFNTIATNVYTTNLVVSLARSRQTESGAYYYRVRSSAIDGATEIFGNYSRPIRIDVPPEAIRRCEVVESCDGEGLVSAWWGSDPDEPFCYQLDFTSTQHVHSGAYALQINYTKSNDPDHAYSFLAASGLYNLKNFDYLSFWVYNDGTPVWLKVRFEDVAGEPWESDWASIFPMTSTPGADWENLVVDLTRTFGATNVNWQAIRHIMFMVQPGDTNSAGTIWLDDVEMHRAVNSAPLEVFESDFYGWAAGALFTVGLDSNVFFNEGGPAGIGHRSLKMGWGTKNPDYSNMTYEPGHDALAPAGRIGHYTNFTLGGNHSIELVVRSTTETNLPILLKLDDADVSVCNYTGTGEWQRLIWGFSHLGGAVNVTKVYVIPYPNQADDGGTLYLDDINITGGGTPAVPYAPQGVTHDADELDEDGLYTVSWGAVSGVAGYEVQEDTDREFGSPAAYPPVTASALALAKNPKVEMGFYYYRVRSLVVSAGATNYGSFSKVMGPVKVVPNAIDKAEIFEDFDGNGLVSGWWGSDPVEPWAYQLDFTSTQHVHSGEYALKVDYNKADDSGNAYTFLAAAGHFNLRNYDYLSFWVYNEGSPLWVKVRIEGQSWSNAWESDWASIFPRTCTPDADWENLVVDLTRTFAAADVDWTDIRQIMLMIEPGSTNAAGTFWMDDIKLWRGPNSAPWEAFEADFLGWEADWPFGWDLATNVCHNDGSLVNGLGQRSLKVTWGVKDADYSNLRYDTAHDVIAPAGRIGNYTNLTLNGNRVLQAWVRSETETNLPILLKFDAVIDDIGVKTYTGTGEWQKLSWDYSSYGTVDHVQKVFLFPHPGAADDGGEMYIDDINLVGGTAPSFATTPADLGTTASDPDHDGTYSITWTPVEGATIYEVQESADQNFGSYTTYNTTNASLDFAKDPDTQAGAYYYRVRACIVDGSVTNISGFGASPVQVRVATHAAAQNQSYPTDCAEVDNINVPIAYPGATGYRITATHPKYFPTTIGERGADFDDCAFTDKGIWMLGTNDSACAEFAQDGFSGSNIYYAPDNPGAGTDEPVTNFPKEINRTWMTNQYIYFTADELSDVNLELVMGAKLTVDFWLVWGDLVVRLYTLGQGGWVDRGTRTFTSGSPTQSWDIADFTWAAGADANGIRLQVEQSSSEGAWGVYDCIELRKRDEGGETVYANVYNDGNVVVDAVKIDFWWRAPQGMDLHVIGPDHSTNVYGVQYFRISKRIPDTNVVEYSQVFVLYEDGNARIEPHPPRGIDWVPFGASVILGPTEDGVRPFVGVREVTLHAKDLGMDIAYDNGGSSHVELWVDRERNVVDVTPNYDTVVASLCRFRTMWVYDGKADIDRMETGDGIFPITALWSALGGPWWKFYKAAPTYHNTYCPEFQIEARGINEAFLTRQAESLDAGSNCTVVGRANGVGGFALNMSGTGGEATFNVTLAEDRLDTTMILRYSDDDGGNNGEYRGNLVQAYVDGALKGETYSANTGGWDSFEDAPAIVLGDLTAGPHVIKIVTGPLTYGVDLDQFELISRPAPVAMRESIVTKQAEDYDLASALAVASRSNAAGGETIALTGQVARFKAPGGVAMDGDEYGYIADTSNHVIRKASPIGVVWTLAGSAGQPGGADGTGSVARFNSPRGVAVGRQWQRKLYVADTGNHTIRMITNESGVVTLAGAAGQSGSADGTGAVARFNSPAAVAADEAGYVYVADAGNHTIRKIGPDGRVWTLAGRAGTPGSGDGVGTNAFFNNPSGIAVNGDWEATLYVADTGNHTIRKILPNGTVTTVAGLAGNSGSADGTGAAARFNSPRGIAVGRWWPGDITVADAGNHTIRRITTAGVVTTLAGSAGLAGDANGTGSVARFQSPDAVAVSEGGSMVYVAEAAHHAIRAAVSPNRPNYVGLLPGVVTTLAGDMSVAGGDDTTQGAEASYTFNVAVARTNTYITVRHADLLGPNKVEVFLDGDKKGRFPAESTGGWNNFTNCAAMYLGALTAGTHTVVLRPNAGTWGVELDEFEIFSCTSAVRATAGRFRFSQDSYSAFEGRGVVTVRVERIGGHEGSVSVKYATSDGTARAGVDYAAATGTLLFAHGETGKTFTVTIAEDSQPEPQETVILSLSEPSGGAALSPPHVATLTISDPQPGWLQFSAATFAANEVGGVATVTVTRTGGDQGAVSARYATAAGTAIAGSDYIQTTGSVAFGDGEDVETFEVTLLNDSYHERNETVYLTLSQPTGGAQLGAQDTAILTIIDDEAVASVIIGENDGSAAEFDQSDYTDTYHAASMTAGDFPKELTLGTWATQHIVIVADAFSISCGLRLTLDVTTNNGAGALTVRVDVDNGTSYQNAGAAEVSWASNGYVTIPAYLLAVGANTVRLTAESGSDGTTSVLWDQIQIMPQFYIQHLAYDGGTDLFPQATAPHTNYTGAASCWMIGRYLVGPAFTQTVEQIHDANTKDPAHGNEISPFSVANWLVGVAYPPYWFACRLAGSLNEALREAVYWMDYVPANGTNAPVQIACGSSWAYKVLRGFETDKKPYDGQGPAGSTYVVHGLWLNDPAYGGLGYNIYVVAEEMASIYTPSGPGGSGYYLVVEPPPDPLELAEAMARISDATLEVATPAGDAEMAAYLQSLLRSSKVPDGGFDTMDAAGLHDPSLIKVVPHALLQDSGFMDAFNRADAHNAYTVNADDPGSAYVLTAGGVLGPGSTVFVLKMNPESGALLQATWQKDSVMYPPVSRDAAIWLALMGKTGATLVSADLVYDPAVDASAFFPRWRVACEQSGQTNTTMITQQADLGGDSDGDGMSDGAELYAGCDPTNFVSGFSADAALPPAESTTHGVIRWPSQTGRTYSLYRATNIVAGFTVVQSHIAATPPVNAYTDQLSAAATFYKVEVE